MVFTEDFITELVICMDPPICFLVKTYGLLHVYPNKHKTTASHEILDTSARRNPDTSAKQKFWTPQPMQS
jgi:hypothetical protein